MHLIPCRALLRLSALSALISLSAAPALAQQWIAPTPEELSESIETSIRTETERLIKPSKPLPPDTLYDDLVDKIRYYLDHEDERNRIALAGYRKVMREDLMTHRLRRAGELIEDGIRLKKTRESGVRTATVA